jgi:hypothetical protein
MFFFSFLPSNSQKPIFWSFLKKNVLQDCASKNNWVVKFCNEMCAHFIRFIIAKNPFHERKEEEEEEEGRKIRYKMCAFSKIRFIATRNFIVPKMHTFFQSDSLQQVTS